MPGDEGSWEGSGELPFNGEQCLGLGRWEIQENDDGESCIIMWIYSVPLNYTVKYGWNSMFYIMWLYHNKNFKKQI